VNQKIASKFTDAEEKVFIAGDVSMQVRVEGHLY
jgi:hypothetical protein